MPKIAVIGDMHLRFEKPYSSAFQDGRSSEWDSVISKIKEMAKDCNAVVLLGDVFNAKVNHPAVIKEFVAFLKDLGDKEIHIIAGNHCRTGIHTTLDFINKLEHPNWHVHTGITRVNICGVPSMMIPYVNQGLMGFDTKETALAHINSFFANNKAHLAFAHHMIKGVGLNGGYSPTDMNEIVLDDKVMEENFEHTFAGHLHNKQKLSPKITMTGNIFTNEVGEHEKSIWTWEDGVITEIPLPVRGIYRVDNFGSAMAVPQDIPRNSIVKVIITDLTLRGHKEMIELIKCEFLSRFDAVIMVEQYGSHREKLHFEDGLDLSLDGLMKAYAEHEEIILSDLVEGLKLIQ